MSVQQPLTNSRRRYEKLTYTPLITAEPAADEPLDALGLAAMVRALMISDAEFTQLGDQVQGADQRAAVDGMQHLTRAISASDVLGAAATLSTVGTDTLLGVARALGNIRSQTANALVTGIHQLDAGFQTAQQSAPSATAAQPAHSGPGAGAGEFVHRLGSVAHPDTSPALGPADQVRGRLQPDEPPAPEVSTALHRPAGVASMPSDSILLSRAAILSLRSEGTDHMPAQPLVATALGPEVASRAAGVLAWAASSQPQKVSDLVAIAGKYVAVPGGAPGLLTALDMINRLKYLPLLFADALTRRPLQPIGLLHLERLVMTPLDVERGELLYSLPLAPNEKVTLAHREWSVTEEQFSEFIEDYLENFSEKGVAESDDLAMSTSTQSSHENAVSMSQPVTSANGVTTTSPVDTTKAAGSSVNDTATQEESKEHTRVVTAKASSRSIKDHKISFTVTTVSGMEDFTAHLIENKQSDKSMRIDYFKRVRKWQSELYRYGVRLTYDVVLPDPGAQLRQREVELQSISQELATEFQLDLLPSDIQPYNWEQLADQYGVVLPAPPDQVQQIEVSSTVDYPTPYDTTKTSDGNTWVEAVRVITLNLSIPQGFQLNNLNVFAQVYTWANAGSRWLNAYAGQSVRLVPADAGGYCNLNWNVDATQVPAEGQLTILFRIRVPNTGILRLTGTVVPTESAMEEWRLGCWSIIRDAAAGAAAQHRSYLRDRQSALQKAIAADDPLRLRRMEREAIMRAVLQWLFPGFEDASSILASLPSPGELDPGTWQQVMEYGEYIKFVETAIDWDNVMVYLYPYFWDGIWHDREKLFLDHPDPIHREFLRAGAARVILAVQPGFEEQVVSLLDQGQLGNLPDQSRFTKAIQDVQEANAAYELTTQGGGADEDPLEPGVRIGTWTDYTPSGALDIAVSLSQVTML